MSAPKGAAVDAVARVSTWMVSEGGGERCSVCDGWRQAGSARDQSANTRHRAVSSRRPYAWRPFACALHRACVSTSVEMTQVVAAGVANSVVKRGNSAGSLARDANVAGFGRDVATLESARRCNRAGRSCREAEFFFIHAGRVRIPTRSRLYVRSRRVDSGRTALHARTTGRRVVAASVPSLRRRLPHLRPRHHPRVTLRQVSGRRNRPRASLCIRWERLSRRAAQGRNGATQERLGTPRPFIRAARRRIRAERARLPESWPALSDAEFALSIYPD